MSGFFVLVMFLVCVVVWADVKQLGCLYLCSSVWFIWLRVETSDEFCASNVTLLHLELPSGNFLFCFVAKNMRTFPISCVLDAHDAYRKRRLGVYRPSNIRWIAQCMELTSGHGPLVEQR